MSTKTPPVSTLLINIKQNSEFIMYTFYNSSLLSIPLSSHDLTIQEAIIDSLQKFNCLHSTSLPHDPNLYSVYPARKSGKRHPDFPAIDRDQKLGNTCFTKFYLQQIYRSPKLEKKGTSAKSIQTEISMGSRKGSEKTQKNIFGGCFCLGKES